jgi:hypothetical protein
MRWIPRHVEYDDAISGDQVDAKTASTRRNQKETGARICGAVEVLASGITLLDWCGTVKTEVVLAETPRSCEGRCVFILLRSFIDVV